MADKTISELTQATQITNEDMFVLQQAGEAKKLLGMTLLDFVTLSVVNVTVTTLPARSAATATYNKATGTLALGIPQGDKGETGDKGKTGDTGPAGPQGETGARGSRIWYATSVSEVKKNDLAIGDYWIRSYGGPTLLNIITSVSGDSFTYEYLGDMRGDKGDDGETPNITIGTVQSGTTASAYITGTTPDLTLDLVLPKGDTGADGSKIWFSDTLVIPTGAKSGDFWIYARAKDDVCVLYELEDNGSGGVKATKRGDLIGPQGEQGIQGPQGTPGTDGKDGAPGHTPVKGTDYFTAADKAELVNDVLAALPAWTGGSY